MLLVPLVALLLAGASPAPSPQPRSFNNDDLAKRRPKSSARSASAKPSPSPKASPSAAPEEQDAGSGTEREQRAALERQWRERFAAARALVRGAEERCWKTVLEPVLVGGNAKGYYVQQEVRKFEETEELRQAKHALEDLEEELRRSGGPPGWARE